jgi:hypothetical protein
VLFMLAAIALSVWAARRLAAKPFERAAAARP